MVSNFLVVDPGNIHQGTAYFEIELAPEFALVRHWTRDLNRETLEDLVESAELDAIVMEEFRLYPELAREQGYSNFPTVEVIGSIRYIARKREVPYFVQGTALKKKARRIGERLGCAGGIRMLGAGRNRYLGWDFSGPSQHERDATAHGVWWAFNSDHSPVKGMHYKRECEVRL